MLLFAIRQTNEWPNLRCGYRKKKCDFSYLFDCNANCATTHTHTKDWTNELISFRFGLRLFLQCSFTWYSNVHRQYCLAKSKNLLIYTRICLMPQFSSLQYISNEFLHHKIRNQRNAWYIDNTLLGSSSSLSSVRKILFTIFFFLRYRKNTIELKNFTLNNKFSLVFFFHVWAEERRSTNTSIRHSFRIIKAPRNVRWVCGLWCSFVISVFNTYT